MNDTSPSAEEQCRIIAALELEPVIASHRYFVATEWYDTWQTYVGYKTQQTPDKADRPGCLTMHDKYLVAGNIYANQEIRLIPGSPNMLVDEKIWCKWVEWYGVADSHHLHRCKTNRTIQGVFSVCMLHPYSKLLKNPKKMLDTTEECGYIELQLRRMFGVSADRKTRLWLSQKSTEDRFQLTSDRSTPINTVFSQLAAHIPNDQYSGTDVSHIYTIALEVCRADGTWLTPEPTSSKENTNEYFDKYLPVTGCPSHPGLTEEDLSSTVKSMFDGFSSALQETVGGIVELSAKMKQVKKTQKELDEKLRVVCDEEKELKAKEEQLEKEREKVKEDRKKLQLEIEHMSEINKIQESRVKLDIGGHLYTTSTLTLMRDQDSMLAAMFSGRHSVQREDDGSYFVDRDGTHFRYILNYLRDGGFMNETQPSDVNIVRELLTEAEYYQLSGLVKLLKDTRESNGL